MDSETQVFDPAVIEPAMIEPAPTETLDPVVEEPLDPAVADPAVIDPAPTETLDPVVEEPLDPAVADPAVIEPATTETLDPVVEDPADPITGLDSEKSGYSNTSNGNQIAVNSTFDNSENNLTVYDYTSINKQETIISQSNPPERAPQVVIDEYSTEHNSAFYNYTWISNEETIANQSKPPEITPQVITESNFNEMINSASNQVSQPGNELLAIGDDDFSCSVSSSRIGRIYRFDSRQYFRGGRRKARVDRIINFSSEAGDGVELSRRVFKGIGELDFTTVANKRGSKRAARTDTDLIYERSSGRLYFNANDDARGFGNNGGLFAIFESSPMISSSDFTIV